MSVRGPYRLSTASSAAPVEFRFDGQKLIGLETDTLASALLANGLRVVSRSFKFHRPRGIFSAGYEEPNAIVQLHTGARRVSGARATLTPLTPGLEVSSTIGWPHRSFDLLRAIDGVSAVFAAGFYNKTFMWPGWRVYESTIRRLAGFGRAPTGPDPDRYDTHHAHCEVLVIGGGNAGVAAAMTAARAGQRVMLVEHEAKLHTNPDQLAALQSVNVLTRTMAVSYYDHDLVALVQTVIPVPGQALVPGELPRERLWLVRTGKVVLATGAIEQPLIFANNDRPGIMLAGAAQRYLERHAIAPGRQIVIATNNDSAYAVACQLRTAGAAVVALVDSRPSAPAHLTADLKAVQVPVLLGSMPVNTAGFAVLRSVTIGKLDGHGGVTHVSTIACDALLVSGGWSPTLHLFAQAGGKLSFSDRTRTFQPVAPHSSIEIVGQAGPEAHRGELGSRLSPVGNTARQWIDLRHDVTVADIELSVRENFTAVEHIKRYTTLGMSLDQGKVGQAPATEVIARVRGISTAELAHTTFRPPFMPVTLGALVGRHVGSFYAPTRRTVLHSAQERAGALFEDYGSWTRAAAFPRSSETRGEAVRREVQQVRHGVGLYDASPLGKIELVGPDALDFADRFYINNLLTLKPGRVRYGIMLRETGVLFDDGTVTVLDEDRVLLTTTSSGAARVAHWLEEWLQCEWPTLRVVISPVTEQWATIALTGQSARQILARLKPDCDISNESLPHLAFRTTRLLGCEARLARVSFSGELTYEIHVPAHQGPRLWAGLLEEGRDLGIEPYGIEALLHLRMEKGFIHLGVDTDGTTVPEDVGFGKPAAAKQRHYVGKRSLSLPEHVRSDRLQLIGLVGEGTTAVPVGSHLRLPAQDQPTDGWVTSAGFGSVDGKPVALALLKSGRSQMGKMVTVHDNGRVVTRARVVNPLFYDPTGMRMNA
jgi:sarcosine oxidase subunit alpha